MSKTLNIVIPMKGLQRAKQRLGDVLTVRQREILALNLYQKTLIFFARHFPQYHRLVVTDCLNIAKLAENKGATALLESHPQGLNAALSQASQWSVQQGFKHQLIIPADIGQLDVNEINRLLTDGIDQIEITIATAKDSGTNALMTSPPDAIRPQFGKNSAIHHRLQAEKFGYRFKVVSYPMLSQDIDIREDLAQWATSHSLLELCYE
jgi:2-phospho-L-lactate guanylyltransferase